MNDFTLNLNPPQNRLIGSPPKIGIRPAIDDLLDAILPLFALDSYVDDPVVMMQCVSGDEPDPAVESGYRAAIDRYAPQTPEIQFIERFDFYKRASEAFAVVMSGDTRKYANIILKKAFHNVARRSLRQSMRCYLIL